MQNLHWISWEIAPKASNMPSQDVWKFTPCPTGHRPFGAAALLSLHFFTGSLPAGHPVPMTMCDPWMTDFSDLQCNQYIQLLLIWSNKEKDLQWLKTKGLWKLTNACNFFPHGDSRHYWWFFKPHEVYEIKGMLSWRWQTNHESLSVQSAISLPPLEPPTVSSRKFNPWSLEDDSLLISMLLKVSALHRTLAGVHSDKTTRWLVLSHE